ncbi:retrovirus-related pol polyprotein from transposon TNT 1-94 [Tanacetum coccineum]
MAAEVPHTLKYRGGQLKAAPLLEFDDEEDTRSSQEYLNDLEEEYHIRALLAKSKRFFKEALQPPKVSYGLKNKGLIAEANEWDEEEVSSDDNEMVEVKVLMALAEENDIVSKEDESSVCNTPLPLLEKLAGAELVFRSKTIKSILKSNSTFKAETLKCDIRKPIWYLDSGCSRHMTGVKSFLHKYVEQPGPKVVFRDNSTCITEGYGSFKCNESLIEESNKLKKPTISLFVESTDAIKFTKPSVDNINIDESKRYLPNEYLHHYEPSQRYQVNSNEVSFIEPYEIPDLVVLKTKVSPDQNDHPAQENFILNNDLHEHSSQNNDDPIIDNLINTEDVQNSEPTSSLAEDASVQNIIPILIVPSSSIPSIVSPVPQDRWSQDKHIELVNIIGDPKAGMLTTAMAKDLSTASAHECLFIDFLSEEETKKVSEALKHPGWVDAMQDELNQFARNKVWTLVVPYGKTTIGSKWVFINKRDETGIVIKNKARLVAQGYNQQEGIEYDETFASIARLEEIRIFLAFATNMNFIVYQMDVKSAFLNDKARYRLKQAPRACENSNGTPNNLGPDLNGKAINETRYQPNPKESYLIAVKRIFRKSTSGACQLLGGKLVCWSAKNHQSVAMSSAKAEYVAAAGCCANILWMKSQLTDYDIIYEKHIDIRYHFIRDHVLKGDIELHFIPTQYQLADIFTKPLDEPTFKSLVVELVEF